MKVNPMEIKIYEYVEIDTLRHRETAQKLLQTINQHPDEPVTLNFKGINFASRAFLHELLSNLKNRETTLTNTNQQIQQTAETIHSKPTLKLKTTKIKQLNSRNEATNNQTLREAEKAAETLGKLLSQTQEDEIKRSIKEDHKKR